MNFPKVILEIIVCYSLDRYDHGIEWLKKKFLSVAPNRKILTFVISALEIDEVKNIFERIYAFNRYFL